MTEFPSLNYSPLRVMQSTRSSPSPPPEQPIKRPVSRPKLIHSKSNYLASASSAAPDDDSSTDSANADTEVEDKHTRDNTPPTRPISPLIHTRISPQIITTQKPSITPVAKPQKWALFPDRISFGMPFTSKDFVFDVRRGGEAILIIGGALLAAYRLQLHSKKDGAKERWITVELLVITAFSLVHPALGALRNRSQPILVQTPRQSLTNRHLSTSTPSDSDHEMSYIWMSDARDYRQCPDDGSVTALLFVPLVASTLLHLSLSRSSASTYPSNWYIEAPKELLPSPYHTHVTASEALVLSRRNLVQLSTFCSFILFSHISAWRWKRSRCPTSSLYPNALAIAINGALPTPEDSLIPRNEVKRSWLYTKFCLLLTFVALLIRWVVEASQIGIWQDLSYTDVILVSLSFQFVMYVMVRLARQGFTLGELGVVAQGATAIFMEAANLTISRIWPVTTPFIKTFRLPTPLLVFQIALIPGAFLVGFLLSPILVLSRNIAQKPSHRLRFPQDKTPHRRALAAGFYALTSLIVTGLIGTWAKWCLYGRNPWLWVVNWIVWEGAGRERGIYGRLCLIAYWGLLGSLSVAGWSRQLLRMRMKRSGGATSSGLGRPVNGSGTNGIPSGTSPANTLSGHGRMRSRSIVRPRDISPPQTPTMTELLDAADKRLPLLGLNGRRKFFHALAVIMFIPGIAIDPAFSHLSFSVAFSLFIFAEYVRYFAIYPFGAAVHLFLNEFLDHKDNGTAILSHFYLLTGCAGSIWFEGPSKALEFVGVLVLGIGDAMASIVGKRWGRVTWTGNSPKTVEGSAAFAISVLVSAWVLRASGVTEPFWTLRYGLCVVLSSILEALSLQNDNLTLPLYLWTILVLTGSVQI
ncbi:hypothetical protein FRC02_007882 [Tulasnella sp. 418]|nr:hypothetical protein FRC02_007882 [Tulasnella sp. 418]